MESIADRLERVREHIASTCARIGRLPHEVTLLAVTKHVSPDRIMEAYAAGQRDFGESYWQEFRDKAINLPSDIRWHLLGHLQTNKVRHVEGRFVLIHSVDSLPLARELSRRAEAAGRYVSILIEVNASGEESKFGVKLTDAPGVAVTAQGLPAVRVQGVMGMAPYGLEHTAARRVFSRIRRTFEELPPQCRKVLSMGMSGDYEAAIAEGSTLVRIGTAIFGER